MGDFCTKCGKALDAKTGKCPECDKKLTKREIKKQNKKENKEALKKAKKEKWKSLSLKEKAGKISFRVLLVFLILIILILSVLTVYTLSKQVKIPIIDNIQNKADYSRPVERDIPPTSDEGILYQSVSEEHIATDDEGITYIDNEILVILDSKRHKAKFEELLDTIGGKIVGYVEEACQYQVLLDRKYSHSEIQRLSRTLKSNDWVMHASPNYVFEINSNYIPNDKKWKNKWDDIPSGNNWGMEAIDAPDAWDNKNKFSRVRVGIIDNMFDLNHEDLNFTEQPLGQASLPANTWNDHGTHTSGTIGACFDNSTGVAGIVPNLELYGVSANGLEANGYFTSQLYNVAFGYLICSKGCSVINVSMGNDKITFEASRNELVATNHLGIIASGIEEFLEGLIDKGYEFVICKAAGNQNEVGGNYQYFRKDPGDTSTNYEYHSYNDYINYLNGDKTNAAKFAPYKKRLKEIEGKLDSGNVDAKYDIFGAITSKKVANRIIMTGAVENLGTTRDGWQGLWGNKIHKGYKIAPYSQCGTRVDILAPGTDIYSTIQKGYKKMSGTSMAAPHVTGVVGLMFSANPNLKSDSVKEILKDTATGSYGREGYGLVNAKEAVEAALDYEEDEEETEEAVENEETQEKEEVKEKPKRTTSDERDIVLVLDASGSMYGTPMEETKKASSKFISTILKEDASIGVVTYDNSASMESDFSVSEKSLKSIVENISDGGGTDIESGLAKAEEMLSKSNAKKKIIVLMSDGEPNDGKVGDDLIDYADKIKDKGTYIYTLGFFEGLGNNKSSAQLLMEKIASEGCHYEVSDADDLVFFFGDIADQINGQKYIYIRIACPVDVSVTYNGETLSSEDNFETARADFGTLTFEENTKNPDDDNDNRIKILRLKDNSDYDVHIEGNGKGSMDYTIGFMDENGEYSDLRKFRNIEISRKTQIDTVAVNASSTVLNVDSDGDGKYDIKYKAKANGTGEIVDYTYIVYIALGILALICLIIICVIVKKRLKKKRTANKKKPMSKKFCVYCGHEMSGDKHYCIKCGKKSD